MVCPQASPRGELGAMNIQQIEEFVHTTLAQHGLTNWTFQWDHAVRRAGQTNYRTRTITLSKKLMPLCSDAQIRDTVLHEVAHALVGPTHGHGPAWQAMALRIGARPQRCTPKDFPRVPGTWVGTCPAGHTHERFRKPKNVLACKRCSPRFSYDNVIEWRRRDGDT